MSLAHEPPGLSWSEIADWYDDLVERGSGPHETAVSCLLRLAGDVAGAVLLDVAAGRGWQPELLLPLAPRALPESTPRPP